MMKATSVRRRRIMSTTLLVVAALLGVPAAPPAQAGFATVAPPYVPFQWATTPPGEAGVPLAIGPMAVRRDGWLLVGVVDGPLHLIPPSGGTLDESNLFGPRDLRAYTMVIRRGLLYVATRERDKDCPIHVLDPMKGTIVSTFNWSQCVYPVIAVDPTNDKLVMPAFTGGECFPCPLEAYPIVEYEPETGRTTNLIDRPDTAYQEAIAFTPDGQTIFLGEEPEGPTQEGRPDGAVYVAVYTRGTYTTRTYRYRVPSDTSPDGVVYTHGKCFGNSMVYADDFGTVLLVENPSPLNMQQKVIATSHTPTGSVRANLSQMTETLRGDLVVASYSEVMVIECPGTNHPAAPLITPSPPPTPEPREPVRPLAISVGSGPAAPPPPAHPGPAQPPPAAPGAPGMGLQSTVQSVVAQNAGLADVSEEQPVIHMAATAMPLAPPPWLPLGVGSTFLTVVAGFGWAVLGRRPDVERAHSGATRVDPLRVAPARARRRR